MSRAYKSSLEDILRAVENIIQFGSETSPEMLETQPMRLHAILYNIQILGEATKNVPEQIRDQYPEIPWRGMAGMRDVLAHKYYETDLDLVWEVVTLKAPELLIQMTAILADFDSSDPEN